MALQLKFVDSHNNATYLSDPPANHKEFQSMVNGLKTCKISFALSANPSICKDLVGDFWVNASFKPATANMPEQIVSKIQGKEICVTEQIIRDVLKIGDSPTSLTEFPLAEVAAVLKRMGYEGSFPPTYKKLLPPFWKFLAHTFVICFSGRKGGADEISAASSTAIVALAMDWDYNFSKFIFDEMRSNLASKKKELFAMYPRFIQMILDVRHPELVHSNNSYDIKALGPNTFGLMKQVRKSSSVIFKGTDLVKFGHFAETEGATPAPTAFVAEEHVAPPPPVNVDDEEGMNLESFAAEAEQESEPAQLIRKRKRRDPRPGVFVPEVSTTSSPSIEPVQAASVPEPTQAQNEPIFDFEEHVPEDEPFFSVGSSHASGSSSAQDPNLGDPNLEASVRLAQFLEAQDSVRQPSATGIHIGVEKGKQVAKDSDQIISELQAEVSALKHESATKDLLIGNLDIRVSELEKDNSLKSAQISELQANLGGLTAMFFDMKNKLSKKFGNEFQSGEAGLSSTSAPETVARSPAPEVNIDPFLASGPSSIEERREKQSRLEKKRKGKTLVMRSSDQNMPGDHPELFMTCAEKTRFGDKYGDRSGILVWGYEPDRNLFVVKRRSGNIEYYAKKVDFLSWTRVDLSELAKAPFYNPSEDQMAWAFKLYLDHVVQTNFKGMKTASSFVKKARGVRNPLTNKPLKNVMWPATKKVKRVPLARRIPDGALQNMEFWTYDPETTTAVIKLKDSQIKRTSKA